MDWDQTSNQQSPWPSKNMASMWFKNETNLVVVIDLLRTVKEELVRGPYKLRSREVVPRMEASPQQKPLKRAHAMFFKALTAVKGNGKRINVVYGKLQILRTEFPLDRRNAELGLDAVVSNVGGEATETEAPWRRTGVAEPRHTEANAAHSVPPGLETRSGDSRAAGGNLPYFAGEARRTVDASEQRSHGALCGKIEGGTATSRRAARSRMGGHDDGSDHGHSTFGGRQAESGGIHVQRELTGDPLAERPLEPVQKNISEGLGQVAVFRGLPDSAHLVPHHQSHESEGCQREIRPGSSGWQRVRTPTNARRSITQAGEKKGGPQSLTSWLRPKMPSIVRTSAEDSRGGQRLLTCWMRPKSSPAPAVYAAPAPVVECISPAPAVTDNASAPVVKYISPAPLVTYASPAPEVWAAPAPVVENISPAPAVSYAETVPVMDYISPAPAGYSAPAPLVEYVSPAPTVSIAEPAPTVYAAHATVVEYISPATALSFAPAPVQCATPVKHAAPVQHDATTMTATGVDLNRDGTPDVFQQPQVGIRRLSNTEHLSSMEDH